MSDSYLDILPIVEPLLPGSTVTGTAGISACWEPTRCCGEGVVGGKCNQTQGNFRL